MIPIVLFDTSSSFLIDIQKKLKSDGSVTVTATAEIPELEAQLRRQHNAVLVMGPTIKWQDIVSIAEAVSRDHPQLGIIVISSELTTDLLRDALRVGIRDVLPSGITTKQLIAAVEQTYQHSQRMQSAMAGLVREKTSSHQKEHRDLAKVITFFSAKGGVGKTLIACNVAVGLAQQTKGEVVLLDLDLQFGDIAVMLQLTPERTIYDVVSSMERLDADLMEGFLTSHSSGLKLLLSPVQPDQAEAITSGGVLKVIEVLRGMSDYLIIDTSPSFNDNMLAVLDNSDEIYLVASTDVPSLKNTKLSIHMMELLQYPKEKINLVLNRANSKVRLSPGDVERALEMKAVASIPSDIIVPLSVNKGIPVILDIPRSSVSRSLRQLVDSLARGNGQASVDHGHRAAANQGG